MAQIPIDERGRFSGYASVFSVPDDGGDIVMPGAFARSSTVARFIFSTEPKNFSSSRRRVGPIPGISSRTDILDIRPRSSR